MTPLTLREWGELRIGGGGLAETDAKRLHALAERASKRLKPGSGGVLTRTSRSLKAGQVVGVLAVPGGRTLEILPKIDDDEGATRRALIRMLVVAFDLPVADGDLAAMDTQRRDLLELLVRLFAVRLRNAVRGGPPRRYVAREEDLGALRGRLDVRRQFTRFAVRPDRLACRYDELSEDTPLNRVLKAAVSRLAGVVRSAANGGLLAELAARFEFVGESRDPLREPVRFDRTDAAFRDLHRLARLFLSGDWQNTAAGRAAGFALLFPMNDLFERFVGRSLKRALAPRPVRLQARRHSALTDERGERLFELRPDAVVEKEKTFSVVDTKWKELKPKEKNLGVSQGDVYQMLAYARAYGAERAILIYPRRDGPGRPGGVVRRWRATGNDRLRLDVAAVDVGRPEGVVETLRAIWRDEPSDAARAA